MLHDLAEEQQDLIAIHYVSIDDLEETFLQGNSKRHDTDKIIESILRHGFRDPIAFDPALNNGAGGIAEGNGRLESLIEMRDRGMKIPRGLKEDWGVPVIFGVNSQSEVEAIAYSVEHNWSVLWGSDADLDSIISMFDQEALTEQLKILDFENSLPLSIDDNLDELLDTLNFREGDGAGYDRADKEIFEDEVPDPEDVETRVKAGEVWRLGKHRLYCGDSTDLNKIKTFVGDRQIDLLITDPPYGVSYSAKAKNLNDYKEKKGRIRSVNESEIQNDDIKASEIGDQLWTPMLKGMFAIAKPGCAYYVFNGSGSELLYPMLKSLEEAGWLLKHSLIWVKNNFVFGRADYHYKHESCFYGWKPGAGHYFTDSRSESSVLEFDKPLKNDLHPTMKPVALIAYLMGNSSRAGELVFDAFLGSGTTLIAAEQSDRMSFGCELSPAYCDVILTRWENLTGKTAVLEGEI